MRTPFPSLRFCALIAQKKINYNSPVMAALCTYWSSKFAGNNRRKRVGFAWKSRYQFILYKFNNFERLLGIYDFYIQRRPRIRNVGANCWLFYGACLRRLVRDCASGLFFLSTEKRKQKIFKAYPDSKPIYCMVFFNMPVVFHIVHNKKIMSHAGRAGTQKRHLALYAIIAHVFAPHI